MRLLRSTMMFLRMLHMLVHSLLIHRIQRLQRQLDINKQSIAPGPREILPHHHAHQLQLLAMRRHGVGGDDPAALAKVVRDGEFVEVEAFAGVEAEGDERQALAAGFGEEEEAEFLEGGGEVVGGAGEVEHDGAVAVLAEADHLVVLADDLGGAFGEVEGEGGLVGAEVVDVEDEFLGQVFGGAPDDPADAGVDKAVFVAGDVDRDDLFQAEVPGELGDDEGGDEASAGGVDVDGAVDFVLHEQVVDAFDVLVFAGVGCADDGTDADGVLVDEFDSLFRIDDKAFVGAVDVAFFDVEVTGCFFPTDLDCRVHDNVGLGEVFACRFALVLPASLHSADRTKSAWFI